MVPDGDDVLQFDVPDPGLQGVPPCRAVPGRAAVVHLDDREAMVDPGTRVGAEAVGVVRGRAAVHVDDQRQPASGRIALRPAQQGVDPPARAVHPDVLDRDRRPARALRVAGAPRLRPACAPRGARPRTTRASQTSPPGRAVAASTVPSGGPTGVELARRPGGPGSSRVRAAWSTATSRVAPSRNQSASETSPGTAIFSSFCLPVRHVPDQQLAAAAALVLHQQPGVAGDRGEPERLHALARAVPQLRRRGSRPQPAAPGSPGAGSRRARCAPRASSVPSSLSAPTPPSCRCS